MSVRDIVLRVEHLTMRFGGLVAVEDLSFAAARGEITALIGPNGAGKTTVFNCITSFYKPSEGRTCSAFPLGWKCALSTSSLPGSRRQASPAGSSSGGPPGFQNRRWLSRSKTLRKMARSIPGKPFSDAEPWRSINRLA